MATLKYSRAVMEKSEPGVEDPNSPIRFTASTEGEKADGFDLRSENWDLTRYAKHPVVIYAHDYRALPLGTGQAFIDGRKLMIDVYFDQDDPFAMEVRRKTKRGMIAGSVGWNVVGETKKNELLEFSLVPIPLDPDALPLRQLRGYEQFFEEIKQAMSELRIQAEAGTDEEPGTVSAGDETEQRLIRKGAVLSARNLADLKQASQLIEGVIKRASVEEDNNENQAETADDDDRESLQLETIRTIRDLLIIKS